MDREVSENEAVTALCREVEGWSPRRIPHLTELARPLEHHWRRPVALASGIGAAALATLLILSAIIVALGPAIPGGDAIAARLIAP